VEVVARKWRIQDHDGVRHPLRKAGSSQLTNDEPGVVEIGAHGRLVGRRVPVLDGDWSAGSTVTHRSHCVIVHVTIIQKTSVKRKIILSGCCESFVFMTNWKSTATWLSEAIVRVAVSCDFPEIFKIKIKIFNKTFPSSP